MSVLARLRGKSQLDVLQLAEEIRAEATSSQNMMILPGWQITTLCIRPIGKQEKA